MRYSKMLIPTLREAPAEAEIISHQLMVRAGFIRKVAAGIYSYLPLCLRVLHKIENIVREEMNASDAQELLLPIIIPSELWIESGRWDIYGKELLRIKDRHDRDFCIGPTHEEVITDLLRNEIRSYRDLPKNCFQIQTKFRDEIRPRFGLMRGREFLMKDGYSFDRDEESAKKTYQLMYDAYKRIFSRCGLKFRAVEAMTGNIGGSLSHEFQVLAESGEDEIVACEKCHYAANVEKAELRAPKNLEALIKEGNEKKGSKYESVDTPNCKEVEDVSRFFKVTPKDLVKTLIFETDRGVVAAMVRGDRSVKESKLKEALSAEFCHLSIDEEVVKKATNAPVGFAGPIGLKIPIIADYEVAMMRDFIVGANKKDAHLKGVNLSDFAVTKFADIRRALDGDDCPRCDGTMKEHRGIEVGQVFYLGTKYSKSMNAKYLDESGAESLIEMGCFGIGISRTAAAAIEQNHDDRGMIWPIPIAPFHVHIIPLDTKGEVMKVAEKIYEDALSSNIEVLIDDREERAGVKFADADLIGIPYQIVIGGKGLKDGVVEVKRRATGEVTKLKPDEVISWVKKEYSVRRTANKVLYLSRDTPYAIRRTQRG
ncbi:MAG: proline--tRNA ligase [Pseudomonadota bacterium]